MSDEWVEWDGKIVMSTPGGPIVTLSPGEVLARKDAEIEKQSAEIERLTREREEARAKGEIRPVVYVLLSNDRGIEDHDGPSDEICGCYLSREAAERAGNELNVRWRIEEYGLEGKP